MRCIAVLLLVLTACSYGPTRAEILAGEIRRLVARCAERHGPDTEADIRCRQQGLREVVVVHGDVESGDRLGQIVADWRLDVVEDEMRFQRTMEMLRGR
jgi:hypothetical protein